jgi:hypothetical protein
VFELDFYGSLELCREPYDEKCRCSILESSRRIKTLAINEDLPSHQLRKILSRTGRHVIEMHCSGKRNAVEVLEFIKLMPNIEVLKLFSNNDETNLEIPPDFRANLTKLRKLTLHNCSFKVVKIFNQLNDDILTDLSLKFMDDSPNGKCFENQRNLRKIQLWDSSKNCLEYLNFQQLKLEEIWLEKPDEKTLEYLKGQDKITNATFYRFSGEELKSPDMKELKSLEILRIEFSRTGTQIDLSSNRRLRKVIFDSAFAPIKSETLEELTFRWTKQENLERLATDCPNLRTLNVKFIDIDSIFLLFPKLESITYEDVEKFSDNLDHENLKHLCMKVCGWLYHEENGKKIIAIAKRCPILESLEVNYPFSVEYVEDLLCSVPRLKALSIVGKPEDYVEVLKKFGGHLDYFRCDIDFSTLEKIEWAISELKDQFDEVTVGKNCFTARKKGSVWFSSRID